MSSVTNLSDLINRFTGGNSGTPEHLFFWKDARTSGAAAAATVAGRMQSLWTYEGSPSHGAAPGTTGAALDNTTQGGLKQTDPGGGRDKWLMGASAVSTQIGTLILYDRLAHDGGFSGTTVSPTAQTVSFTPPSRYSSGAGNQIWIEINSQIGASSTTITASYTDQGSASGNTTPAVAIGNTGLREINRIIPMTLAAGDTGVQNVASTTLAATTGTAGDFAVLLVHPLCLIPVTAAGVGVPRDFITGEPGPIKIEPDACLAFAWLANGTTAPQILGDLHMVEA